MLVRLLTIWAAQASREIFHTLWQRQRTMQACTVLLGPEHTALWWWESAGFVELISLPGYVGHRVCPLGFLPEKWISFLRHQFCEHPPLPLQRLARLRVVTLPASLVLLSLGPVSQESTGLPCGVKSRWRQWGRGVETAIRNCNTFSVYLLLTQLVREPWLQESGVTLAKPFYL